MSTVAISLIYPYLGVCFKCGDIDSDLITCEGKCQRTFHRNCFKTEGTSICIECNNNEIICPKCQTVLGEETIDCSMKNCVTKVHLKCSQNTVYRKRETENTQGIIDTG